MTPPTTGAACHARPGPRGRARSPVRHSATSARIAPPEPERRLRRGPPGLRRTGRRHVGVADGLDLLDPVARRRRASNRLNRSSSRDTTRAGSVRWAHGVKPTMSAKTIVVAGYASAIRSSPCRRRIGDRCRDRVRQELVRSRLGRASADVRVAQEQERDRQRDADALDVEDQLGRVGRRREEAADERVHRDRQDQRREEDDEPSASPDAARARASAYAGHEERPDQARACGSRHRRARSSSRTNGGPTAIRATT